MILSFFKILINYNKPKVYWFCLKREDKKENFGDIVTPYLVEKLTTKKPFPFHPTSNFSPFFKHSMMVGSIIMLANKSTQVWGSGIIKTNQDIEGGNFLAVRGPRTGKRLEELGFKNPKVYGDPAILLPLFYNPKTEKKYKIGVIAHYVDFDAILIPNNLQGEILKIDLLTNNIEDVLDKILSCDKIISTSLHGVIVAHSYKVPALWWKFSNKLSGDDVKFYDYFESVNLNVNTNYSESNLIELFDKEFYMPSVAQLNQMRINLLHSFPYKIKNKNLLLEKVSTLQ